VESIPEPSNRWGNAAVCFDRIYRRWQPEKGLLVFAEERNQR
jgi:hypothetical protein